jgi:diaminopimelate epimerase
MEDFAQFDVEQAGFIVTSTNHFEMSGNEFCGNGTRAAGLLFSRLSNNTQRWSFSISGHGEEVSVEIDDPTSQTPCITGTFPNLSATAEPIEISGVDRAEIVDMGGIVHVIIYGKLPEDYKAEHVRICTELGLTQRGAVGVDWIEVEGDTVTMHPVVWVRDINSYFYESACGSGSISVAEATGIPSVIQPSGQVIVVTKDANSLSISSKMEMVHAT